MAGQVVLVRIFIDDRWGKPVAEIPENEIISATQHEEINGEHSLTLVTTRKIRKGYRLYFRLETRNGYKWYEYAVAGVDEEHYISDTVIRTYYCPWSVQEDLQGMLISVMPGIQSPVTAQSALDSILASTQGRWTGVSNVSGRRGASMYDRSAWDALSTLIETWGGEIDVDIEGDDRTEWGVEFRKVVHYDQIGSSEPQARFDFGGNVSSVRRTFGDAPLYSRMVPRGKGEKAEGGGYGRKITIASVNDGKDYLTRYSNDFYPFVDPWMWPGLNPTLKVENSNCETPAQLKAWAESVLEAYCGVETTYTVNINRLAGIDDDEFSAYRNLQLGDVVQVVDDSFGGERIELESRIVAIDRDLLDERNITYQISTSKKSIASKFSSLGGSGGTSYSNPSVSSAIGGVEPASTDSVNIAHYTNTNICSVSLSPGIWLITGRIRFETNTTGQRTAKISTVSADTSSVISTTMMPAFTGMWTHVTAIRCLSLASQTTVYLVGWQNSGATLECNGEMECTRIGDLQ